MPPDYDSFFLPSFLSFFLPNGNKIQLATVNALAAIVKTVRTAVAVEMLPRHLGERVSKWMPHCCLSGTTTKSAAIRVVVRTDGK